MSMDVKMDLIGVEEDGAKLLCEVYPNKGLSPDIVDELIINNKIETLPAFISKEKSKLVFDPEYNFKSIMPDEYVGYIPTYDFLNYIKNNSSNFELYDFFSGLIEDVKSSSNKYFIFSIY